MISLREFLSTGRFGPLELGATEDEVLRHLGQPDDREATSRNRRPRIWLYGSIELYFDDGRLTMIFTDHFEKPLSCGRVPLDAWILTGGLDINTLQQELNLAEIDHERRPFPAGDDAWEILTQGQVSLKFNREGLYSISRK